MNKPKILLVDNAESYPDTVREFLELRGYQVLLTNNAVEAKALVEEEIRLHEDAKRQQLLTRANEGEIRTLGDAHALNDAQFYKQVLQTVLTQADDNPKVLQSIADHIVDGQNLRSSSEFAETMINVWSQSPDQYSLAKMLYLAGLAEHDANFQAHRKAIF